MAKRTYKVEIIKDDLKKPVDIYYIEEVNIVETAIEASKQLKRDLKCKHKDKELRVAKIEEVEGDMI